MSGPHGLLERTDEIASMVEAVRVGAAGEGALVVVRGPAGIGKTSLLAVARAAARAAGMEVFEARGGVLERDMVHGLVRQLFERRIFTASAADREAWLAGPARLALPALRLTDEVDAPVGGAAPLDHGLFWLVANLAERAPLALFADDAHWGDAASLGFLLYLARRLTGLPVLLVVAARSDEPTVEVDRLAAEPEARTVDLAPLSVEASAELLRAGAGGDLPPEAVRAGHEVTGGNPFFLVEIGDALGAGAAAGAADIVELVGSLVPATVGRALLLRVGGLGREARRVADALAVLGDGTSVGDVAAVGEVTAAVADDALTALGVAGLTATTAVAFAHPIVRTAIYGDLTAVARARLHARAAEALIERGAGPEVVAHHLLLTAPAGDAGHAAVLAVAGAAALARGDGEAATRLLERAVAEPCAPDAAPRVRADLGRARLSVGQLSGAAADLRAAFAAETDADRRVAVAMSLAEALAAADAIGDAVASLHAAAAELEGEAALRLRVQAAIFALFDPASARVAQEEMTAFANFPGTSPAQRIGLASAALATAFAPDGRAADAVAIAERALADGRLVREAPVTASAVGPPIYTLTLGGALDGADEELQHVLERSRAHGAVDDFVLYEMMRLDVDRQRGDLVRAAAHGASAIELARAWGDSPVALRVLSVALCWMTEVLLEQGKVDDAAALVRDLGAEYDFASRQELVWGLQARALVALSAGEHEQARADFEAVGRTAVAVGYEDRTTSWRVGAALTAAHLGDPARARALVAEELVLCRTWQAPGPLSAALRAQARIGPVDEAIALLTEAVAVTASSAHRLESARAKADLGVAQRRAGMRVVARAALTEAADIATACGGLLVAERARADLVVLGARPQRLRISGVDALTPSERRVADLAARGQTNREIAQELFVTPKTVEAHLHQVFRKLDLKRRTELADALAES